MKKYCIELSYEEEKDSAVVMIESDEYADVCMIARGWLMASFAIRVDVYDSEGDLLIAYTR